MKLPPQYAWLAKEAGPKILLEGLRLFGIKETAGAGNTPEIMAWARETNLAKDYVADAVPWCGLWMAVVAQRAGWTPVDKPLWAQNWNRFGAKADKPSLGDILVFGRTGGGHVGVYVGEDATAFHVLGGNQSDQVCITRILKTRLLGCRRPVWRIAQPANVRPIKLAAAGALSKNEA